MIRRPTRYTLFPYTTHFRSPADRGLEVAPLRVGEAGVVPHERAPGELRPHHPERDGARVRVPRPARSEEHTSELQSRHYLVSRLLLVKIISQLVPILLVVIL